MRGRHKRGGGTTGQLEFSGVFIHSSLVCGFFRASSRCSDLSFCWLSRPLFLFSSTMSFGPDPSDGIVSALPAFHFPSFASTSHLRLVSPSSPPLVFPSVRSSPLSVHRFSPTMLSSRLNLVLSHPCIVVSTSWLRPFPPSIHYHLVAPTPPDNYRCDT